MPIIGLLIVFALYNAVAAWGVFRVYPSADSVQLFVALSISSALAFLGVVLNGIFPSLPLGPGDYFSFTVMVFLGVTAFNAIALNVTLERGQVSLFAAGVLSAIINLALLIVFSYPLFSLVRGVGEMLFSTPKV